jgi:hypothetical protein
MELTMRTIGLVALTLSLVACADGADGTTGAAGPAGATGTDGTVGATGAPGTDGQDGADGADGATGPSGEAGADGADVLVSRAPAEICDGTTVSWGVDDDGDGTLDADEVDGSQDLCDGTDATSDGTDGADGSVAMVVHWSDQAGVAGCSGAADALAWGTDDDGNGLLDPNEVDGTHVLTCTPFELTASCPMGQLAIGVTGRQGAWLDQVGFKCATITDINTTAATPSVGGGGGTLYDFQCPAGSAIASIEGTNGTTNEAGWCRTDTTIRHKYVCKSVSSGAVTATSSFYGEDQPTNCAADPDGAFDYVCPAGAFVSSMTVGSDATGAFVGFTQGVTCSAGPVIP